MITREQTDSLLEAIVNARYPSNPTISPDGQWVAWVETSYGHDGDHPDGNIWIAPTDGSRPGRRFTSGDWQDSNPHWSPDSRSIAFLSDRAKRGTNGLYVLSIDGGEARELVVTKSSIQSLDWAPDGKTIAFISPDEPTGDDERRKNERDDPEVYGEKWPYARLRLLDLGSGDVRDMPTGERHINELAWSPLGDRIALLISPTPEMESRVQSAILSVRLDDGEVAHVCDIGSRMSGNLTWTQDGLSLCFAGSHGTGIGSMTLHRVEATGGDPVVIGPSESDPFCSDTVVSVTGESRLLLLIGDGLNSRLEWVDPESGQREAFYSPEDGDIARWFDANAASPDGPKLAIVHSTGSEPMELYVGAPGSLVKVSNHHADLADFTFGSQEPFYWTSSDGVEVDGVLIRPPDAGEGPFPLLVHIHGGPYGRDTLGWNLRPGHWAQWMAVHGYAVLLPNYRGGMGHGHDFARWGDGGVGDMEFVDVMSGVDAAIERGIADPDRLGIGGWSQGGFLTAWGVTQTNRFKAGVMGAGVSDWGMMVMTSDIPTVESMLGGGKPWDGPGPHRFMQHSPISHARNAETPLLILHGKNDERVPVSQAIGFHRALRENGVESELVIYPREPHGIRERNHQRDMFRRVRDWFVARV